MNNSSAALWVGVTNVAVITNSGPDIVTTNLGNVYKPKTPEVFGYDGEPSVLEPDGFSKIQGCRRDLEVVPMH